MEQVVLAVQEDVVLGRQPEQDPADQWQAVQGEGLAGGLPPPALHPLPGLRGRQMVAPKSIIAWAKSPGRSPGVIAATRVAISTFDGFSRA